MPGIPELSIVGQPPKGEQAVTLVVPREQLHILVERHQAAQLAEIRYKDAIQLLFAGHGYTDGTLVSIDTDHSCLNALVPKQADD